MSHTTARFHACQPMLWHGRYGRMMGDSGVFHVRYTDGHLWPVLVWETDAGVATCRAIDCAAAVGLLDAVARIKRRFGGEGGGSFLINEYGKVLVPASDGGGQRFLAGRLDGRLLFENPFSPAEPIDLGSHEMLENGDRWKLPYVGIPYHLHRAGRIYFFQQDESGGRSIYPPQQDLRLIRAIRKLRPYGPVRISLRPVGWCLPSCLATAVCYQKTFGNLCSSVSSIQQSGSRRSEMTIFPGNCPHNVSKDAKYSVRGTDGRVGLMYSTADGERWHMTTDAHPELADMVNEVKRTHGTGPRGPFYINEYKQVIVPVGDHAQYYLAGTYDLPLRFEFEGKTISGEPLDLDGNPLRPGDTWTGPHAGIPYVLTAAGNDVYYRTFPRPNVEKRVKLSTERGKSVAAQIARLLSAFKGSSGGRFYVNEFCSVFSPISGTDGLQYLYVGQIDLDSWFPDPLGSQVTPLT